MLPQLNAVRAMDQYYQTNANQSRWVRAAAPYAVQVIDAVHYADPNAGGYEG